MKLRRGQLRPVSLTLREALPTAHGTIRSRAGFVVQLESESGRCGWGECFPLAGFGLESLPSAGTALRAGIEALLAASAETLDARLDRLEDALPHAPAARAALDLACHDLAARERGVSVAELFTTAPQVDVGVAALIGGSDPQALAASAIDAWADDFRTLKLKIGARPLADDLERVAAVRKAVQGARVRLDANGAWSHDEAHEALRALAQFTPEFVEQPIDGPHEAFARLRGECATPIAADEAIRDAPSAEAFLDARAVDAIVLKPAALGGLRPTFRIAEHARERGVPVLVTSFLDSSLGIAGALELARCLPSAGPDHGLTTDAWLSSDLAKLPPARHGRRTAGAEAGLGIAPAAEALERAAAGDAEWVEA